MSNKIDYEKKQFEAKFLKEFSALTRFPQSTALRVAREYVEDILILYNDGFSPLDTARYICKLINIDEIKRSQYSASANTSWR